MDTLHTHPRVGLAVLALTLSACVQEHANAHAGIEEQQTSGSQWTHIERPNLLGVQDLLAHERDEDALLLARARLATPAGLSAPEQMWLHIYEGIALDRIGRRDEAVVAYGLARDLHPHPVALRGLESPLHKLRHLSDFDSRHGIASSTRPNRELFRARMEADRERYGAEMVDQLEALYQVANGAHDTLAGRTAVETLLRDYPESNRAGCGLLYMAQWETGEKKVELLRAAIADHADAIYGDGVQVGAYATHQLADAVESDDERAALLATLQERWPAAVDHRGRLLLPEVQ